VNTMLQTAGALQCQLGNWPAVVTELTACSGMWHSAAWYRGTNMLVLCNITLQKKAILVNSFF
jgi:hypothetical protein